MTCQTQWWSLRVCEERGSKYQDGEFLLQSTLTPLSRQTCVVWKEGNTESTQRAFCKNGLWAPLRDWDMEKGKDQPAGVAVGIKWWYIYKKGQSRYNRPAIWVRDSFLPSGWKIYRMPRVNNNFFSFIPLPFSRFDSELNASLFNDLSCDTWHYHDSSENLLLFNKVNTSIAIFRY